MKHYNILSYQCYYFIINIINFCLAQVVTLFRTSTSTSTCSFIFSSRKKRNNFIMSNKLSKTIVSSFLSSSPPPSSSPNRIICSKCYGEGKVKSRLTRKAKLLKRMEQQEQQIQQKNDNIEEEHKKNFPFQSSNQVKNNLKQQHQQNMISLKNCNVCSGTGLILNPTPYHTSHTMNTARATPTYVNMSGQLIPNNIHVGIIGGGIGGLALALALQHRSIPFTIYEKDNCFEERKQGYGLTMQQGSQALLALGLFHEEKIEVVEEGEINDNANDREAKLNMNKKSQNKHKNSKSQQETKKVLLFGKGIHSKRHLVHEPDGNVIGSWGLNVWGRPKSKQGRDAKRQNAHIQRQELRRILYDQIVNKEECIKWGHKFLNYSNVDHDSKYRYVSMTFAKKGDNDDSRENSHAISNDVITYTSTVLVGADGIHSAVRNQKIGEDNSPLRYLDCIVILGITSSPQSSSLTSDGETVFQTADGQTRLYAMPFARKGFETAGAAKYCIDYTSNQAKGETMWQLSFPMSEEDAKALSSKGPSELKKEAIKRCGQWHAPIPEMLHTTPDELISGYPVYDREIVEDGLFRFGNSHKRVDTDSCGDGANIVTMIGDAAHPMSPFKGQGANQALLDAVLLARTLFRCFRQWGSITANTNNQKQMSCALGEFESNMLKRCSIKVRASADSARFLHSDIAITKGNITRAAAIKNALSADKI